MDPDFAVLLARAQEGDEAASLAIWNSYYARLVNYARAKMKGMPRRAADEEDVALSAMNSFFQGAQQGRFSPGDANELWKLLATITVRKATGQLRKHHAEKRGGGRVRGDSAFEANQVAADPIAAAANFAPSTNAESELDALSPYLGAACEELLGQLDDPALRRIALLRLAGHTNDEIAQQLQCSVATVKRRVANIREQWSELR